tara:strand:+ start:1600 stop:2022 length:423 start_codon:yes stop_codon:yes gene_type:complete
MKKILIAILMLTLSFSSYSQRKSKKTKSLNKSYMLIKIIETNSFSDEEFIEMSNLSQDDAFNEVMTKEFLYRESNIKIKYEFGLNYSKEEFKKMNEVQLEAQTIAQAINGAAQFGWQIASTNTVLLKNGGHRLHYIYMSK